MWKAIRHGLMFLLCLVVFLLTACQGDEVCEDQTSNDLRLRFYLAGAETESPISIDSLIIFGLGNEHDLIYNGEDAVSLAGLPMDPGSDSCGFVLVAGNRRDTLMISYNREVHFLSAECGFTMFFHILEKEYTSNLIDTVVVSNPLVSNVFNEHIKVFMVAVDHDL